VIIFRLFSRCKGAAKNTFELGGKRAILEIGKGSI
jgi:hypothetical protein